MSILDKFRTQAKVIKNAKKNLMPKSVSFMLGAHMYLVSKGFGNLI